MGGLVNIVMIYEHEGSSFFDELTEVTTFTNAGNTAAAASVHDELAADVTVGTTFDVKSSEEFMMFFFDEITATIEDADAKMCVAAVAAAIVFEYDGEFTTPIDICGTAAAVFKRDSLMTTHLNTLTGVANGVVAITGKGIADVGTDNDVQSAGRGTGTTSNDLFNTHFPWGATAKGNAHGMITVTLPLGLDGSKFRMHLQTKNGKQLGMGSTSLAGQVYVHRARNNNGRTFEVTQAYENKVAGATTFSKVNAATGEAGLKGSGFGSPAVADSAGLVTSKYIPGTYYNVRLLKDAAFKIAPVGSGKGVFVKVVVGVGAIKHVEITAGGIGVLPGEKFVIGCDTRIHPDFNDCDGTALASTYAGVTFGASDDTVASQNVLGAAMRDGAVDGHCVVGTTGTRFDPTTGEAENKILGARASTDCSAGNGLVVSTLTSATVTHPGVTDVGGTLVADVSTINVDPQLNFLTPSAGGRATFNKQDMNLFYYQAGFYDTVTPQFYVDALHAGALEGGDVMKAEMMTVMGGRQDR